MRLFHPRFLTGVFIGTLLASIAAGLAVSRFVRPISKPAERLLLREGFNFSALRSAEIKWRGPAIGEKIDLSLLRASSVTRLSDAIGGKPVLLVSVNPECRMCKNFVDEMQYLRQHILPLGTQYYAVSFTTSNSPADFQQYAKALGFDSPAFQWLKEAPVPPALVTEMTIPSHLLVDGTGTVIRVWSGSNADAEIRQRMGGQIVEDSLVITETLQALSHHRKQDSSSVPK